MEINDKTSYKALKEYIKENGFQKIYLKDKGKPYTKATKDELRDFVKEQQNLKEMENNVDTLFGNTILSEPEPDPEQICIPQPQPNPVGEDQCEIEEIPIFKNESKSGPSFPSDSSPDDLRGIKLNSAQLKVKRYITRFPEKLRSVTSRSTFKSDFAKLRDPLSEKECEDLYAKGMKKEEVEQINEANSYLLNEVEQTLNSANIGGLVKDQVFVTISFIEDIIRYIRDNKDGKIPAYITETLGNVRIDGLSVVLDARPDFHDCLDELLIKYDNYGSLLSSISVEKRILLIILGAAVMTHKINTQESLQLKNANAQKKDIGQQSRFSGL